MRNTIYLLALGLLGLASVQAEEAPHRTLGYRLEQRPFPGFAARSAAGACRTGRADVVQSRSERKSSRAGQASITSPLSKAASPASSPQKSPQFYGADLALFEPGGSVWFFLPQHCLLLGYDGKAWIDYVIPDARDRVVGYCPTRGGCTAGRANRFAQDAAWFVCARSILRFDGKNWSNQPLSDKPQPNAGNVLLTVSSDGRTVAACSIGNVKRSAEILAFPKRPMDLAPSGGGRSAKSRRESPPHEHGAERCQHALARLQQRPIGMRQPRRRGASKAKSRTSPI